MRGKGNVRWTVAAVLVVVYAMFPVVWILSLSFKQSDDISNNAFLPSRANS